MAPFEALYGKRCRSPLCWDKVGERRHLGPEVIVQAVDKIRTIQEHLRQHRIDRRVGQIPIEDHWSFRWESMYF